MEQGDSNCSVSTLRSNDSFGTAGHKVSNFLKEISKDLKQDNVGMFEAKELVREINEMLATLSRMEGRMREPRVSMLVTRLRKMKKTLLKRIDQEQKNLDHMKNMPRASIQQFNTDKPENYLDYRHMMKKIKIFPTEDLNISTLMASIKVNVGNKF